MFEMMDVALVAVGAAVAVLPAAWILCCLQIIQIILSLHSSRTKEFSCSFVCPILQLLRKLPGVADLFAMKCKA